MTAAPCCMPCSASPIRRVLTVVLALTASLLSACVPTVDPTTTVGASGENVGPYLTRIVNTDIFTVRLMELRSSEPLVLRAVRIGSPEEKLRASFQARATLGGPQLERQRKVFVDYFEIKGWRRWRGWRQSRQLKVRFVGGLLNSRDEVATGILNPFDNIIRINRAAIFEVRDWAARRSYGNLSKFKEMQDRILEIYVDVRNHPRKYRGKTANDVLTPEEMNFTRASLSASTLFRMVFDFILLHEAGHYYLRHSASDDCVRKELEADAFAVIYQANTGFFTVVRSSSGVRNLVGFQARFSDEHRIGGGHCGELTSRQRYNELVSVWNYASKTLK